MLLSTLRSQNAVVSFAFSSERSLKKTTFFCTESKRLFVTLVNRDASSNFVVFEKFPANTFRRSVGIRAASRNFFSDDKKIVTTLEASTGKDGPWSLLPGGAPSGAALMDKGLVDATVHPDLPPVTSLKDFFLQPLLNKKSGDGKKNVATNYGEGEVKEESPVSEITVGFRGWQVRTVAAQTGSMETAFKKMNERAKKIEETGNGGSLLLVSGGHPLRQLPLSRKLLPANSEAMLREGHKLRQKGELPNGLQLWAVENPLVESVDRLERKVEAGAEAIITQPPLLPGSFLKWWEEAESRGLLSAVPVIVGLPIISSFNNLAFWINLTNSSGAEADSVLEKYKKGEAMAGSEEELRTEFRREEVRKMTSFVCQLPGIAGVHLMPVTPRGWRELTPLLHHLKRLKQKLGR